MSRRRNNKRRNSTNPANNNNNAYSYLDRSNTRNGNVDRPVFQRGHKTTKDDVLRAAAQRMTSLLMHNDKYSDIIDKLGDTNSYMFLYPNMSEADSSFIMDMVSWDMDKFDIPGKRVVCIIDILENILKNADLHKLCKMSAKDTVLYFLDYMQDYANNGTTEESHVLYGAVLDYRDSDRNPCATEPVSDKAYDFGAIGYYIVRIIDMAMTRIWEDLQTASSSSETTDAPEANEVPVAEIPVVEAEVIEPEPIPQPVVDNEKAKTVSGKTDASSIGMIIEKLADNITDDILSVHMDEFAAYMNDTNAPNVAKLDSSDVFNAVRPSVISELEKEPITELVHIVDTPSFYVTWIESHIAHILAISTTRLLFDLANKLIHDEETIRKLEKVFNDGMNTKSSTNTTPKKTERVTPKREIVCVPEKKVTVVPRKTYASKRLSSITNGSTKSTSSKEAQIHSMPCNTASYTGDNIIASAPFLVGQYINKRYRNL